MPIKLKRIYEPAEAGDGMRILVDRLWPRGLSKEKAKLSLWLKDIAPTDELRKWFGHDPKKWPEFKKRYKSELTKNPALEILTKFVQSRTIITLLYSAKDQTHNQAIVIKEFFVRKK